MKRSIEDRKILSSVLASRGERQLETNPFADSITIGKRIVELPNKVEPNTLEARLARFDVALSAVGAEHSLNGQWNSLIHPLARVSVERREVLLLKPLVNWKFALNTLERMRRYAQELDYTVPSKEEAEVWKIFDSQPDIEKRKMLERLERTSMGGYGVRREVSYRLR